jgi:hypothetical protein
MATSAFGDKAVAPADDTVCAALGVAAPLWSTLWTAIAAAHAPIEREWVWGGKPHGWSLRLRQRKRAVLYMTPCAGFFRAAFAIGGKAADAAHDAGLGPHLLQVIEAAPRFAEGRAVRLEVRSEADIADVLTIAALKMSH